MKGKLIVFEGLDNAGKSTQIILLKQYLINKLKCDPSQIITTSAPSKTDVGIKLRNILIDEPNLNPVAQLLLFMADHSHHVESLIKPALTEGKIVLCDRFVDSTIAYHEFGYGVDPRLITRIPEFIRPILIDHVLYLDASVEMCMERMKGREQDRLDKLGIDFYRRVKEGFDFLYQSPNNVSKINADRPMELVQKDIEIEIDKIF
jgi:dTMP kinase